MRTLNLSLAAALLAPALGQGGEGGCFLHSTRYDFNDEILPLGAALFGTLVERAQPLA